MLPVRWILIVLALLGGGDLHAAARPNVLFVISDDLTATALGCYGNPLAHTPNLDRLAQRGVKFERAYCQFPRCAPSRASILTGLRPAQTGVRDNETNFRKIIPETVTLPQAFKNAGYQTVRIGKLYHQGVPSEVGKPGMDDPASWDLTFNPSGLENKSPGESLKATQLSSGIDFHSIATLENDELQADGAAARQAIDFLESRSDKPFFLAVGFYRPHVPLVAPARFFDLHPPEKIHLPYVPPGDTNDISSPEFILRPLYYGMTEEHAREMIRAYYATVSFMDAQFGKILDALDRLNLSGNTIVVFLSDHGYHLGEHRLWQKMSLLENVTRVPLIIADPRVRLRNRSSTKLVELIDLYPTLIDLCRIPSTMKLPGTSLRPLLESPTRAWPKDAAITDISKGDHQGQSIRTERWRYIEWDRGRNGIELYDHSNDPHEFTNLAQNDQYARVVADLRRRLRKP